MTNPGVTGRHGGRLGAASIDWQGQAAARDAPG